MNPNKWQEIVFKIEEKFGIDSRRTEDFIVAEQHSGEKIIGQKEIIEFKGPLGKIRLEKISQPKVIDKKVLSSKRIGGRAAVDYVYSDEDKSEFIKIYKWDDSISQWTEISNI